MKLTQDDQIIRELATAFAEDRSCLETAVREYYAELGETVPTEGLTITNLSMGALCVEGAAVKPDLATFFRGRGFEALLSGDVMVAKLRPRRKKPTQQQQLQQAAKKVPSLQFFNEDDHLRIARKLYEQTVEAQSWANFPQFLHELDRVIIQARAREGHDDTPASQQPQSTAPLKDKRGTKTLAGTEPPPPFGNGADAPAQ